MHPDKTAIKESTRKWGDFLDVSRSKNNEFKKQRNI